MSQVRRFVWHHDLELLLDIVVLGEGNTTSEVWNTLFVQIGLVRVVFKKPDLNSRLHNSIHLKLIFSKVVTLPIDGFQDGVTKLVQCILFALVHFLQLHEQVRHQFEGVLRGSGRCRQVNLFHR